MMLETMVRTESMGMAKPMLSMLASPVEPLLEYLALVMPTTSP